MRIAIVSDIHANMAAWNIALKDIGDCHVDQIICLGDLVGYGPDPVAVLESVYQFVAVILQGNHDAALCRSISTNTFHSIAADGIYANREQLDRRALAWLRSLPLVYAGSGFKCVHGEFTAPADFNYISEPEDALPSWKMLDDQLLFVGHTHVPGIFVIGRSRTPYFLEPRDFELEPGKRYIVNPGSIGYPRAHGGRSTYCIYDRAANSITFRQLPFDSAGLRRALSERGMREDQWLHEKELSQTLPIIRKRVVFSSFSHTGTQHKARLRYIASAITAALLVGTALFIARTPNRKSAVATINSEIRVPEFDLTPITAYPLVKRKATLLPPLPTIIHPPARCEGWRYTVSALDQPVFTTGLREGRTTLIAKAEEMSELAMESPLIDLAGVSLTGLRLRGRIRKHPDFEGHVFYQLLTYVGDGEKPPLQQRIEAWEMRTSKRRQTPPGAERDVKIRIAKKTTHVRFRITAHFRGTLEIEQPVLFCE